jgi:UDP-N-acetylmuramate--alanine ligase
MYNSSKHHLHFIGIGGVGMAGIAEVLLNLGYSVSGSDLKSSKLVEHLTSLGAKVSFGHRAENVPANTTVVVVSSAINPNNPELLISQERKLQVIPRAMMLSELMRMKYGIAVGGAHGKTTTTTMIAHTLKERLDPVVIIGGRVLTEKSGARVGLGEFLVAEADESDGSFCLLKPAIAVATNIDAEHLSHYGSMSKLEESFQQFLSSIPFYGLAVICGDDPVLSKLSKTLGRRVLSYGLSPENDLYASDLVTNRGKTTFKVFSSGKLLATVTLPMPGIHMVCNSLAAFGVGMELGLEGEEIANSLESFPGVARRSEVLFDQDGILLVDDYGHHPTEISATLSSLRRSYVEEGGRLVVLFQPHRYSRTRELFVEFITAFEAADEVIISDIYSAGEEEISGISGEKLASALQHKNARFIPNLADAVEGLVRNAKAGDVYVTLGAGSVSAVAHEMQALFISHFE